MLVNRLPLLLSVLSLLHIFASLVNAEDITFGATIPVSGDFASYGASIREGLELAKEEAAKAGQYITIIYEDACLPAQSVTALRKLKDVDKIDAIVGNFCVIGMTAMAPEIEKSRLPTMQTAAASDSVINAGDFIFTTNIVVRDEARALADYAFDKLGAKTASIFYITTDFGKDYDKYFSEQFVKRGGAILSSDTSPIGANDFRAELLKVKVKNPDVVFAATSGLTLGMLLKQARETGLKQNILSQYEAEDPSVLEIAKQAAEGLTFYSPIPVAETKTITTFRKRFESKYGHSPLILSSNAYDAFNLLTLAFRGCQKNSECVRDKIRKTKNYDGASGEFSINEDGGTSRGLILMTVKDGKFLRMGEQD